MNVSTEFQPPSGYQLLQFSARSEIGVESWDDNAQETSKIDRLARLLYRDG